MKQMLLLIAAMLPLAGCASHRGGTSESQQEYSTQSNAGEAHPEPMSSPTFRPGMNPEDVRNPQFPTRAQPDQSPPQSGH